MTGSDPDPDPEHCWAPWPPLATPMHVADVRPLKNRRLTSATQKVADVRRRIFRGLTSATCH